MADIPIRCSMVSVLAIRREAVPQVLLLRRSGAYLKGVWSYVAGHLEDGERGWQCALRELEEETGLKPQALYSSDTCERYYDARNECIEVVPCFVALVAADRAVRLDGEHDAFRWASFEEAADRLPFGGQRRLLAHVRREFVERTPCPALRMPEP